MGLEYDIVDVFTDRPFAGNQLAVVHGADDLSTEQCLKLAREFNFSETTFPSSSVTDGREYATRIFTPGGEIPFAGHPTLGTAWVLKQRGALSEEEVRQVCGAGRIGVRFRSAAEVELAAAPHDLSGPLPADLVSDLLADVGLGDGDLTGPAFAAGCGLTFVHLPVVAGAVERAVPSARPLGAYVARHRELAQCRDPVEGVNLVHVSGTSPTLTVHARVFVPGLAVPEDPATGSAAAGLGVALVAAGDLPEGGAYTITQGVEMGRPSELRGSVETESTRDAGGAVATMCRVAGDVHPVARGEIAVPG